MRKYFTRPCIELAGIEFATYFILTLNTRAIASINYIGTLVTNMCLAGLVFVAVKRITKATTREEQVMFTVGATLGAQVALWCSTMLFP
jgi:large-conductance mechanosensitive channel